MAFDITSVLKGAAAKTEQEQIVYIPLDQLDPDPSNWYSLDGLNDLAANIELIGLQQPIRVRPGSGGHYVVVSGHRRRAACMLIRDGDTESAHMFDNGVPCIIDNDECSDAMRELRLIYANSATRVMTPAEISRQAERIEALLYQLSEEGVEFKGRMRDHVAKACAVSKSKIARLHAIRNNLVPALLAEFDAGSLNESVAYRMSQEHRLVQQELYEKAGVSVRGYDINATERAIAQLKEAPRPSPSATSNEFWEKWEENRERIHKVLEDDDDEFFEMLVDVQDLFIEDLYALNTRKEGIERLKEMHGKTHHGGGGGAVWDFECKPAGLTLQRKERTRPITRSWTEVYDLLCTIALNETAGKSRVSEPDTKTPSPTGWSTGTPTAYGDYAVRAGIGPEEAPKCCRYRFLRWNGGAWVTIENGAPVRDTVYRWVKLPED